MRYEVDEGSGTQSSHCFQNSTLQLSIELNWPQNKDNAAHDNTSPPFDTKRNYGPIKRSTQESHKRRRPKAVEKTKRIILGDFDRDLKIDTIIDNNLIKNNTCKRRRQVKRIRVCLIILFICMYDVFFNSMISYITIVVLFFIPVSLKNYFIIKNITKSIKIRQTNSETYKKVLFSWVTEKKCVTYCPITNRVQLDICQLTGSHYLGGRTVVKSYYNFKIYIRINLSMFVVVICQYFRYGLLVVNVYLLVLTFYTYLSDTV